MDKPLSEFFKVPGRQVYCDTKWQWVKSTLYCHVWLRVFPPNLPSIG